MLVTDGNDPRLLVTFPPQRLAEEALAETGCHRFRHCPALPRTVDRAKQAGSCISLTASSYVPRWLAFWL
jgi:hypothetical protein